MRALQADFAQAPLLGSLLDPARSLKDDLATSNVQALRELLTQALAQESSAADAPHGELLELALSARGLLDAARLLHEHYPSGMPPEVAQVPTATTALAGSIGTSRGTRVDSVMCPASMRICLAAAISSAVNTVSIERST